MSFSKVRFSPRKWLLGLLLVVSLWAAQSHNQGLLSAQLLNSFHAPAVVADGGVITPPPG